MNSRTNAGIHESSGRRGVNMFICCLCLAVSFSPAVAADPTEWNTGLGNWFDPVNWSDGVPGLGFIEAKVNNGGTATISGSLMLPETVVVYASDDASIHTNSPHLNSGTGSQVTSFQFPGQRTIGCIKFDLSDVAMDVVDSTTLSLRTSYKTWDSVCRFSTSVFQAGTVDWSESTITYDNAPWQLKGSNPIYFTCNENLPLEVEIPVVSGVRGALGEQLSFSFTCEGAGFTACTVNFYSRESSWPPELRISGFSEQAGDGALCYKLFVAENAGDSGNVEMTGGSLSAHREYVGYEGTGAFVHTGGENTVPSSLYLGYGSSGDGSYHLSGTGVLSTWYEYIGYEGVGHFTQSGGVNSYSSGSIYVGYAEGSRGVYELSGSGEISGDFRWLRVGHLGTGQFIQTGGFCLPRGLYLGEEPDSDGSYDLSGTGYLATESVQVGRNGSGTFRQTGGTALVSTMYLGYGAGSSGIYELSGSGQLSANSVSVGESGTGIFTQTGGQLSAVTMTVGDKGTGTFRQTGGTALVSTMYLGYGAGSSGIYELSGSGQLSADGVAVGNRGIGTFTQTGGTNTIALLLILGSDAGSSGTYALSGSGELLADTVFLGWDGSGTFTQTGGNNTISGSLYLGYFGGSSGTYELSSNGQLSADSAYVGYKGTGTFTQTGGNNTISGSLYLGRFGGSSGTYELSSNGQLSANRLRVGASGVGVFRQTGGTNAVSDSLSVGLLGGSSGTYELSGSGQLSANSVSVGESGTGIFTQTGGQLSAVTMSVGDKGTGTFRQTGGTNALNVLLGLGSQTGSSGIYELSGTGRLSAMFIFVGNGGAATFTQTGGTNTVSDALLIGSADDATYTISDGDLSTRSLYVVGNGTLNITGSSADITVSRLLRFASGSRLTAVPGSTIHMTGSAFENENTDPAKLAGLSNLTLVFEGGSEDVDPFEVAGEDRRGLPAGLRNNFLLDTLTLGDSDIGQVQLVDLFDNQPRSSDAEALYVRNLNIGPGCSLDLNGLALYYVSGAIDAGASITGGTPTEIYTPASSATVEGVPVGSVVTTTLTADGSGGYGTAGMTEDPEARALSFTVELDNAEVLDAIGASPDDYLTLKMSYDEMELAILEIEEATLRPYWWDESAGEWVLGGTTTTGLPGEGVFAGIDVNLDDYGLGYCGLDTAGNFVWTNINHASVYGAGGTPEPATLSLLALGGLVVFRRRKK